MADSVLGGLFQTMMQSIAALVEEIKLESGLKEELKRLKDSIKSMNSIMADIENMQRKGKATTTLLSQLQEVANDAKDLLDELETEIKRRANLPHRKVRDRLSLMNPKRGVFRHRVNDKMTSLENRLATMARDNGLNPALAHQTSRRFQHAQSSTDSSVSTALRGEHTVFGREDEIRRIVERLTNAGKTNKNPSVLAIQAIGSIGKSTLAREVYHRVRDNFHLQMWVSFSPGSNTKSLLTSMVVEIQGVAAPLLVLDGMWDEHLSDWDCLKTSLLTGAWGSWIVVTTRSIEVADAVRTEKPFHIKGLSDDHCWSIFAEHAFKNHPEHGHRPELKEIGIKIAKKCNGSPSAARILGCQLQTNHEISEWQTVLESDFAQGNSKVLKPLRIGYDRLPAHLKRCFKFCSIFPKGFLPPPRILLRAITSKLGYVHYERSHS